MNGTAARALDLLRIAFGEDARFRDGQLEAVEALVDERRRVLVVERTGWGKSVVYFLATRLLRDHELGPTILISPLLSLMRDQLRTAARLGVTAATINSANLDDWDAMIDSNIKGLVYCTRLLLPGMIERGRGHVVNLGSVAGEFPYPGGNVYGGAKAFVHQFSNNLRADLLGTPVRVTNVEPGMVGGSEFSEVRFKGDKKRAAAVYEGADPLTSEDIADVIHWIVTRPARVNINHIQLMPVCQAYGPLAVKRKS